MVKPYFLTIGLNHVRTTLAAGKPLLMVRRLISRQVIQLSHVRDVIGLAIYSLLFVLGKNLFEFFSEFGYDYFLASG